MKFRAILPSIISLTLMCCTKHTSQKAATSLNGSWKMIVVYDSTSNSSIKKTKPDSIAGDVLITFVAANDSTGTFSGHTPTNEIVSNPYYLKPNGFISVPMLGMSYVTETWWGALFANNIMSATTYSLKQDETLEINTTTSKQLVFQKQH